MEDSDTMRTGRICPVHSESRFWKNNTLSIRSTDRTKQVYPVQLQVCLGKCISAEVFYQCELIYRHHVAPSAIAL